MSIFNKNKIKVKSENVDNGIKYMVAYYNLKNPNEFKRSFLRDILGENKCLAVIDTKLLQGELKNQDDNMIDELIQLLEKFNIQYRKIKNKGDDDVSVLGFKIKVDSKNKKKNYIISFAINSESIEKIQWIIDNFNLHYYVDESGVDFEELLNKFQLYDEDELSSQFVYDIFDSIYLKQLVIISTIKTSQYVKTLLGKYEKEN